VRPESMIVDTLGVYCTMCTIVSFSYLIFQKAKGDIKKKGKPDPYAYVPLHFQSLNKRCVMTLPIKRQFFFYHKCDISNR
jgi:hypothetical protein